MTCSGNSLKKSITANADTKNISTVYIRNMDKKPFFSIENLPGYFVFITA
jgi:hypothetical protein